MADETKLTAAPPEETPPAGGPEKPPVQTIPADEAPPAGDENPPQADESLDDVGDSEEPLPVPPPDPDYVRRRVDPQGRAKKPRAAATASGVDPAENDQRRAYIERRVAATEQAAAAPAAVPTVPPVQNPSYVGQRLLRRAAREEAQRLRRELAAAATP